MPAPWVLPSLFWLPGSRPLGLGFHLETIFIPGAMPFLGGLRLRRLAGALADHGVEVACGQVVGDAFLGLLSRPAACELVLTLTLYFSPPPRKKAPIRAPLQQKTSRRKWNWTRSLSWVDAISGPAQRVTSTLSRSLIWKLYFGHSAAETVPSGLRLPRAIRLIP